MFVATAGMGLLDLLGERRADWTIAGVLLFGLLLIAAFLLSRFVARHGHEIGEARFDTTNKSGFDG